MVVLLTLGAMSFFERMFVEHQAVRAHIRQTQARYFAESGIEYIKALGGARSRRRSSNRAALMTTRNCSRPGWWPTTRWPPSAADSRSSRPRWVTDGYYSGIRYGLENESARLNLNTILLADNYQDDGAHKLLMALPGMTDADCRRNPRLDRSTTATRARSAPSRITTRRSIRPTHHATARSARSKSCSWCAT